MTENIHFVTGVTGFLGGEYLRTALLLDQQAQFYCLIRDDKLPAVQRLQQVLQQVNLSHESQRVFAVPGDMTLDQLGLDRDTTATLAKKITHILHAAALVKFEKPMNVLAQMNIRGTENIISFAKQCKISNPNFKVFAYVSTAYVAGKRPGIVTENDFSDRYGFKNNYEATKFAAEALVHPLKKTFPVIIFRPTIILGHSENGSATRSNVIFPLLQVIKKITPRWLPFNRKSPLDLVSVDYVAQGIYFLLSDPEAIGHTFHLSCGLGKELSVQQVMDTFNQIYHLKVKILPYWLWPTLIQPSLRLTARGRYLLQRVEPYWLYTVDNPRYSQQYTQEKLNQYALPRKNVLRVLEKTMIFMRDHL